MRTIALLAILLLSSSCGCGPGLPDPDGPHNVGTVTLSFIDDSREEARTEDPDDKREVLVQIFYPTEDEGPGARLAYPGGGLDAQLMNLWAGRDVPAQEGASLSSAEDEWPVVVYSAGYPGSRVGLLHYALVLASHGYVVVGIDHPYYATRVEFPDGRAVDIDEEHRAMVQADMDTHLRSVLDVFIADQRFILSTLRAFPGTGDGGFLAGRLDLSRLALLAFATGGMAMTETADLEDDAAALITLNGHISDAAKQAGLSRPTLFVTTPRDSSCRDSDTWCQHIHPRSYDDRIRLLEEHAAAGGEGMMLELEGARHSNLSIASAANPLPQWGGQTGPIDGEVAMQIVADYTRAFLDRHLRGLEAPLLDAEPAFEEARVTRFSRE